MKLARLSLAVTALAYLGFGIGFLIKPELLETIGITLGSTAARVEIRGFYGGLELGVGVFFALAVTRPAWYEVALVAQSASLGGLVLGRLVGCLVDGWPGPPLVYYWSGEVAGCLLGLVALQQLRRARSGPRFTKDFIPSAGRPLG
jgi:hypothetical protein